ncbi:hypothetical protein SUGI_0799060 [Cryptomeria japonica]|uniref:mitochondrial phosphate carrier protein 1, mitochondrial isoform X2 n=1 Tax=Cryptomeria japonica TaxID=3369 RepID=UPI002414893F|nr:mitochondrial phosphate carrier protein 1, mitochondrial isoform X2 [Cryptomeria japonica]GLJ39195.1 hypothetical protein SUGI_0799060 [Cryptomeria japonica]
MIYDWAYGSEAERIRLFSAKYYAACAGGGMVSAGATHLLITPLDMLKVNMQVDPAKYRNIWSGFGVIVREQGPAGLWKGWAGKLFGYGVQGGCRFGLYEYFKKFYSDVAGKSNLKHHKTSIYIAGSASAQIIADLTLCPFEAVKVKVQTQPRFAKGLVDGFPRLYSTEGLSGFYKGIVPLWCRNLPFAMIMFSTFEHTAGFLYQNVLQKQKVECSIIQQLGITCAAGYMAGTAGTIVSTPADNIVACMYNKQADTVLEAIKKIGIINLFTRSLPIRIALVGPVITTQWFIYDTIKVINGVPTSGGIDYFTE